MDRHNGKIMPFGFVVTTDVCTMGSHLLLSLGTKRETLITSCAAVRAASILGLCMLSTDRLSSSTLS